MSQSKPHPSSVGIDISAKDGSLLHFILNQNPEAKTFTEDSLLEVMERTRYGLRPLVAYRVNSFLAFHKDHHFVLHAGEPNLAIDKGWMIHLADWIEMMIESSHDLWGAKS